MCHQGQFRETMEGGGFRARLPLAGVEGDDADYFVALVPDDEVGSVDVRHLGVRNGRKE
jgi:hypothetical protein